MNIKQTIAVATIIFAVAVATINLIPGPDTFEDTTKYTPCLLLGIKAGSIIVKDQAGNIQSIITPEGLSNGAPTALQSGTPAITENNQPYLNVEISDMASFDEKNNNVFNLIGQINRLKKYRFDSELKSISLNNPNTFLYMFDLIQLSQILKLAESGNSISFANSILIGTKGEIEFSENGFNKIKFQTQNELDTSLTLPSITGENKTEKKIVYKLTNTPIGYKETRITVEDIKSTMKNIAIIREFRFGQATCAPNTNLASIYVSHADLEKVTSAQGVVVNVDIPFIKFHNSSLFNCHNPSGYSYHVQFFVYINGHPIDSYDSINSDRIKNKLIFTTSSIHPFNPNDDQLNFSIQLGPTLLQSDLNFEIRIPPVGYFYHSGCPSVQAAPLLRRDSKITLTKIM